MNGYELSRKWFDWCFDNASKIKPIHTALFFFIIEHNNRLGWKKEFGLPRDMTMDAIGVKNNRTFTKAFNDLEDWGFIEVIERSKNQYSANIISLFGCVKNTPATTKALDKATYKQLQKQRIGIAPINKPINHKPINDETDDVYKNIEDLRTEYLKNDKVVKAVCDNPENKLSIDIIADRLTAFNSHLTQDGKTTKTKDDYATHFRRWQKVTADIVPQVTQLGGKKIGDEHNGSTIVRFSDDGRPVVDGRPYKQKRR